MRTASIWRGLAMSVAVAAPLLLSACGGDDDTAAGDATGDDASSSVTSSPEASAPDEDGVADACSWLSDDEVGDLVGLPVVGTDHKGSNNSKIAICVWEFDEYSDLRFEVSRDPEYPPQPGKALGSSRLSSFGPPEPISIEGADEAALEGSLDASSSFRKIEAITDTTTYYAELSVGVSHEPFDEAPPLERFITAVIAKS